MEEYIANIIDTVYIRLRTKWIREWELFPYLVTITAGSITPETKEEHKHVLSEWIDENDQSKINGNISNWLD